MIIQNNIMALNSFRQLSGNNNALAKNLEKLSSGFRINRAGDDAAGLAISEKMRAQIRGLETAQKNAQDGISLIQTAEGALTEVHSMLNRMTELATQAANGIYDNQVDRRALDDEFQALKSEIDRISQATNFNGQNLLDGSLSAGGLSSSGNVITTGRVMNFNPTYMSLPDLTDFDFSGVDLAAADVFRIDGREITVNWDRHLNPADQLSILTDLDGSTVQQRNEFAAAMERGINAAIAESGLGVSNVSVSVTSGGELRITSGTRNGDSAVELVSFGTDSVMSVIEGDVVDTNAVAANQTVNFNLAAGANSVFVVRMGDQDVAVTLSGAVTAGTTTMSDLASVLQNTLRQAATNFSNNTTGAANAIDPNQITVEVGRDGNFVINNGTGLSMRFADIDNGQPNTAEMLGLTAGRGMVAGGGLNLQIGDTADQFNIISVSVNDMSSRGLGIDGLNIASYEAAVAAVGTIAQQGDPGTIKGAINVVSAQRATLGALQNRLEHTINNLGVTTENLTAAESRIRDTDMAKEMMDYTKNNILVQAAQAMLAQANMAPQGVLQLIR